MVTNYLENVWTGSTNIVFAQHKAGRGDANRAGVGGVPICSLSLPSCSFFSWSLLMLVHVVPHALSQQPWS